MPYRLQAILADNVIDYLKYHITFHDKMDNGLTFNGIDKVTVNEEETPLSGTPTSDPNRFDYATSRASMEKRPEVDFDNHVKDGAMRTLSFTKWLYDVDGVNRLHYPDDPTLFTFRLYLGNENEDAGNLPLADMYDYHVKDPDGNYCRFNKSTQKFESLGKTDYDALNEQEKVAATFTTSIYGTISKIPADYTVEVRDLIVGVRSPRDTHCAWKTDICGLIQSRPSIIARLRSQEPCRSTRIRRSGSATRRAGA